MNIAGEHLNKNQTVHVHCMAKKAECGKRKCKLLHQNNNDGDEDQNNENSNNTNNHNDDDDDDDKIAEGRGCAPLKLRDRRVRLALRAAAKAITPALPKLFPTGQTGQPNDEGISPDFDQTCHCAAGERSYRNPLE